MPIDHSIYGMIRPAQPGPGPLEQYAQMAQVRNLMGAGELHDLQRRKLEADLAEEEAFKQAFRTSPEGKVNVADLFRASPTRALQYQKSDLENQKTRGEIAKSDVERRAASVKYLREKMATVNDQPGYDLWREEWMRLYGPEAAQGLPAQFTPEVKMQLIATGDKWLEQNTPKFERVDVGGQVKMIDVNPITNPAIKGTALDKTMTPGEVATDARAKATLAETIRHHGVIEGQDKFGLPQEVTGPDGKPRLVMQNKRTGEMVDANTKEPISGAGPKLGERATMQVAGVANVKNAITEYRDALKKWGALDIANPNARARMGTIYNNMMLQAKEAYNLGVLNGPDYKILTDVVTDPTSLKGGITGKGAMDDQAKKLDEIMTRIGQTVTNTQSGVTPSGPAAPKPPPANRPPLSSIFGKS